ncbi:hypothetical protein E1A91_A09G118000v1 [Gossypium mustelinum]|uniref:JmjC domain-containing protein n=1 Tax=Gossypium mustelinum TaxID=34275 RepID=A0A5D2XWT6_GOSMU|nr:hypothetical protein E1A91_A09G118000v1 [Gossypium mustelinum]
MPSLTGQPFLFGPPLLTSPPPSPPLSSPSTSPPTARRMPLSLTLRSLPSVSSQPMSNPPFSLKPLTSFAYPPSHLVAYLQQQNDCFRTEYSELESDCDAHIPWASEALGCLPEAVNLWIGNHLSQTSFHKDHYENLYAVVSGEKHFLLLPPTDVHRMYIKEYPAARYSYSQENGEFRLEVEEPERYVPWSSVDPCPARASLKQESLKFPLYFNGPKPFEVTVKAGEVLYLPSMWFHHVRQSPGDGGCTIAVNYWYDMQFDIKYAYFNFLQSLPCRSIDDQTIPEGDREDDSGPHASSNHLNSRFSGDESATNNVEIHKDRDNVQVHERTFVLDSSMFV